MLIEKLYGNDLPTTSDLKKILLTLEKKKDLFSDNEDEYQQAVDVLSRLIIYFEDSTDNNDTSSNNDDESQTISASEALELFINFLRLFTTIFSESG